MHFLGIPEGDMALGQAAIYLAVAPKSDAAYRAMDAPVSLHLRNAPTARITRKKSDIT